MEDNTKIFCIGLNKTGTVSLHEAFLMLGISSVHFISDKGEDIKEIIKNNHENNRKLMEGIEEYRAYSDWSIPSTNMLFKDFDKQYPGSKFILNTRDLEGWLNSREKHVNRIPNLKQLQKQHPDNPWYTIDKENWKIEYDEHHKDVHQYFKGREKELLVFDLSKGDSWEKLCPFLDAEIPKQPFPKSNTAKSLTLIGKIRNKLSKIIKKKSI